MSSHEDDSTTSDKKVEIYNKGFKDGTRECRNREYHNGYKHGYRDACEDRYWNGWYSGIMVGTIASIIGGIIMYIPSKKSHFSGF